MLGVPFADADDADRAPWLDAVADGLRRRVAAGPSADGGVLVCSALKRRYRDRLRRASGRLFFVHLEGPYPLIAGRLTRRGGHFMPSSLPRSQCEALEPLGREECGAAVGVTGTPEETRGAVRPGALRGALRPAGQASATAARISTPTERTMIRARPEGLRWLRT